MSLEPGARLGQWVAYSSDESGRSEVYLQGSPASRGTRPITLVLNRVADRMR